MRIYMSGAFIGSHNWEAALKKYEQLGIMLREAGFVVYLPHTHTDPIHSAGISAMDVFMRDTTEVYRSDLVVAILDEPSHGVGAEVALAICQGITVIGAGPRRQKVSRFIIGMLESSETSEYFEYEHLEEVVEKVIKVAISKGHALCASVST